MDERKLVYQGKTKDVYRLDKGRVLLRFKDDVTGTDGVFDPGANTVGLSIEGMGRENLAMSAHFFKLLKKAGLKTHFLSANLEENTMEALAAVPFGKGVEVICRRRAAGSFVRRYGAYVEAGAPLQDYVEMTLKDDGRGDPLITAEALEALGIMDRQRYDELSALTRAITKIVAEELDRAGLELVDIKYEFGLADGELVLMDEIAAGNMRVLDAGRPVEALALTRRVLRREAGHA